MTCCHGKLFLLYKLCKYFVKAFALRHQNTCKHMNIENKDSKLSLSSISQWNNQTLTFAQSLLLFIIHITQKSPFSSSLFQVYGLCICTWLFFFGLVCSYESPYLRVLKTSGKELEICLCLYIVSTIYCKYFDFVTFFCQICSFNVCKCSTNENKKVLINDLLNNLGYLYVDYWNCIFVTRRNN